MFIAENFLDASKNMKRDRAESKYCIDEDGEKYNWDLDQACDILQLIIGRSVVRKQSVCVKIETH